MKLSFKKKETKLKYPHFDQLLAVTKSLLAQKKQLDMTFFSNLGNSFVVLLSVKMARRVSVGGIRPMVCESICVCSVNVRLQDEPEKGILHSKYGNVRLH